MVQIMMSHKPCLHVLTQLGYVTRTAIRISVFTRTRISLIQIGIWIKGL